MDKIDKIDALMRLPEETKRQLVNGILKGFYEGLIENYEEMIVKIERGNSQYKDERISSIRKKMNGLQAKLDKVPERKIGQVWNGENWCDKIVAETEQ